MTPPLLEHFAITEIGVANFIAEWQTNVPCHARIQISTSRSMVSAVSVGLSLAESFRYDSRGESGDSRLPAMGRYWVRALVEDADGNQDASDIVEVILPEGDAIREVLICSLGGDYAVVSWCSAEPTIGQAFFTLSDGTEIRSAFESSLRENHCITLAGLRIGETYAVRIRQGLEREKWADQYLYSETRQFTVPAMPNVFPYAIQESTHSICFCHERLRLLVRARGSVCAFLCAGDTPITIVDSTANRSSFSITLDDGSCIDEFPLATEITEPESVQTEFGEALRVTVSAEAERPSGTRIRRQIMIDLHTEHPDAAVIRVSYESCGSEALAIKRLDHLQFQLDRRLSSANGDFVEPWHFHAYLPVSHTQNFGETYSAIRLEPGFARANKLAGDDVDSAHHCGVPCFDFWGKEMGLAIGHLSAAPIPVSVPVCVNTVGRVEVGIREEDLITVDEQGVSHSPPLFLAVHKLDFYEGVSRFRKLMATRDFRMPTPPVAAFETVWSTWGYSSSFTKNDIRKSLPLLKELNVKWIQFDDPWYADHGDMTVNQSVFPGGQAEMTDFIAELREEGFKVRLWVCSGHVSAKAPYALSHANRLIQNEQGEPTIIRSAGAPHNEYEMCPCLPENRAFSLSIVEKFFTEYGASAIYQDGVYGCPVCLNRKHGHDSPFDTLAAHAELYREAYVRLMDITDGEAVVMLCTCGKVPDFYLLPSVNRVATADPMPIHVRKRVKSLKALLGPRAAVDFDFIELSANDFASAIGTGAALYLKFTVPLEPAEKEHYVKWLAIAREHDLARAEYLNLYDLIYDYPETHVLRQKHRLYYAFYASQWSGDFSTPFIGEVEFRGLSPNEEYQVYDYVNNRSLGIITKKTPCRTVEFFGSLLVHVEPSPS